jgi:hypothetical protein
MPKVHTFNSTGEAYDASQTHEEIKDGDVLSVPSEGAVAFLTEAWPVALDEASAGESFHVLMPDADITRIKLTTGEERDYTASAELARSTREAHYVNTEAIANMSADELRRQIMDGGPTALVDACQVEYEKRRA